MSLLELLLVVQTAVPGDSVPPHLAWPEPGLDDPAAYEGYETRVYRDASGNAFQIYLNRSQGRVVHLWADALNESAGFTARDSAGAPAELAWSSGSAVVGASGRTRSVSYGLEAPSSITLGLLLLGSMRVERDFQYARRDSLPLDATPFPQPELSQLIDHIAKLPGAERARHLALLGVKTPGALRARLLPRITEQHGDTAWVVRVEQVSFDGKTHLWLAPEGDARETVAAVRGGTVRIRRPAGGVVRFGVRVTTDAPALTPLSRAEIFNDDFRRFSETVRGDSAHPDRFRRLEREVRGMELLCSREKLMAGLPNFATYFGRDMLMTALLMEPVWAPAMPEHVIASALRKLSPAGDVSHEEALGGQAIREHASEYNRLVDAGQAAQARAVLQDLQAVRENYVMVDDDFQLPVVAARYLSDQRVPAARKRTFLLEERHLQRLVTNLAYVTRQAAAYARNPVATKLVSFPRDPDGRWISASWRDSRDGYGGGRFAMDVNVIWVPHALEAVGTILDVLQPYPWGLFVDDLGPLVANDTYASRDVWERFRRDPYHSPTVVWGRDVNALLAGLAKQIAAATASSRADVAPLRDALQRTVTAVDRSGLRHAELWSYRIENGRLLPVRCGTSSDVQLWSLTDLAVQFWLDRIGGP